MMMKMMGWRAHLVVVAVLVLAAAEAAEDNTMQEKCGADFQKLAVCLSYATGKATMPTKDCCTSVKGIRESEPECLCFIMQQTHSGNDKIKSMGIQESKLFQLPSACSLHNATLSDCPKLLGLDPNSPAAAIFNNNSTAVPAASTVPVGTGAGTSQSQSSPDGQNGSAKLTGSRLAAPLAIAVAAFVLSAFPAGFSE